MGEWLLTGLGKGDRWVGGSSRGSSGESAGSSLVVERSSTSRRSSSRVLSSVLLSGGCASRIADEVSLTVDGSWRVDWPTEVGGVGLQKSPILELSISLRSSSSSKKSS